MSLIHAAAGTWRASAPGRIRRIPSVPPAAYSGRISRVPLTGGQAQGVMSGTGTCTLSVGPQGLGNVWYPAQISLSTSGGIFSGATAVVYLGAQGGIAITQVASVFTGTGVVATALPPLQPGEAIIIMWSGAAAGQTCAVNVAGTMDALSTG